MATRKKRNKLRPLIDSDLHLPDPIEDIRWRTVVDATGAEIGTIDELLIDERARKVRFLRVESGGVLGIGTTKVLIPALAVGEIEPHVVHLKHDRDMISGAPGYDPKIVDEHYYESITDYFGY